MLVEIAKWLGIGLGSLVSLLFLQFVVMVALIGKQEQQTTGNQYFGRSRKDRLRFRNKLRFQRMLLFPLIWILGKTARFSFRNSSFPIQSIAFPKGTCTPELVENAISYEPQSQDLFVVTPMRCGTTWMQHLLYQILTRGQGDLGKSGQALYAISPWIESRRAVPLDEAPLVGSEEQGGASNQRRIIKTHLPSSLCPFSKEAKYVYVTRDAGGCLASCFDFLSVSAGELAPDLDSVKQWFTDPHQMWWGCLPDHVAGWYRRYQENPECVFFVRFSELKSDLRSIAVKLNSFLDAAPLSDAELDDIERKCSFEHMREHANSFEMMPPHLFHSNQPTLVSGSAERGKSLPEEMLVEVEAWYRDRMKMLVPDYPAGD